MGDSSYGNKEKNKYQKGGRGRFYFWNKNNYSTPAVDCSVDLNEDTRFVGEQSNSCPYKGWKHYFPHEEYKRGLDTANKVSYIYTYIKKQRQQIIDSKIEEKKFYCFDYKNLSENTELCCNWPKLQEDLTDNPAHTLSCMSLALHQLIIEDSNSAGTIVRARLNGFHNEVLIKNLKAAFYGKLVSVKGTVIRVGAVHLMSSFLTFSCNSCSTRQSVCQPNGVYRLPTKCPSSSCTARSFTPVVSSRHTVTRSTQTIKLQENIEDDRDGGRVPRTVECELTDDLVDTCGPGDNVTVMGIVQVNNTEESSKKSKSANLYTLFLEGVSIVNMKGKASAGRTNASTGVEFSLKDYYAIQEIYSESNQFRLLVNSMCPSVYGQEMVKMGILLALLGGAGAGVGGSTRGDPHVLVVGDPGLGKSHMLHASAAIAPRGVYVCGNTTTSSGLTVTLTKESGGDFALEAGALVLADKGCCCIDEFDKMSSQHQALLEAMEQQSISIAKGGIVCTLPARTSIIAAANPVGGHYNKNKTVAENLKMGQPLLSRFDLVFILLDKPNEQLDSLLSEHVMALHSGTKSKNSLHSVSSLLSESLNSTNKQLPLSERLKISNGEPIDLVPQALMRKYIAYARKYIPHPKLLPEAAQVLQNFYLELRKIQQSGQGTPVTTRQLESMIRLTQARAKSELREEATGSDAQDIVELMRWSMLDTYTDEAGNINFGRSQNGSGMSGGSKVKRYIAALQTKAEIEGKSMFTMTEMKDLCSAMNLKIPDFYSFIATLNTQGFLLKKGANTYQLLSV